MTIVPVEHQRFPVQTHRQQAESTSEPPASWTLAHVPAKRGHIANLRTGSVAGSVGQHLVVLLHLRILGDFNQSHQRSDAQSLCGSEGDSAQLLQILYVDQALRM